MAGKSQPQNVNKDTCLRDKTDYNPKLDFYSEKFDPLLALRTPGVVPPVANAKIHDNLARYQSAVEVRNRTGENAPKIVNKKERKVEKPMEDIQRRWLPHQMPIKTERKKINKNIFTKMACAEGPLSLLTRCVDTKCKIKVFTRNCEGIRGYCIGFLLLFDKHWNLAMADVEEVWTRKKKRKIAALETATTDIRIKPQVLPPPITIIKSTSTTETCQRHVKQLMMRGEHVALIIVLNNDGLKTTT